MNNPINPEAFYHEMKRRMNYKDDTETCNRCKYFVPTDISGAHDAESSHCTKALFKLPVNEAGRCDFIEILAQK